MRDSGIPFLLSATLAQVGVSIAQQGIAVVSFAFRAQLHLSLPQAGGLVSATSLGVMVTMLLGGSATDRYGPRPILIISACLAPITALALTFAHAYGLLLLALVLVGFSVGAVPIGGARAVFFRFSGPLRGTAMGIRQTGVTIGAALAAAFLPAYVAAHGPYAPWIFLSAISALFGLVFAIQVPRFPPTAQASPGTPLGRDTHMLIVPAVLGFTFAAGQYGLLTYTVPAEAPLVGLAGAGALLATAQIGGMLGRVGFGLLSDRLRTRGAVISLVSGIGALGILLVPRLGPGVPYALRLLLYFVTGAGAVGWNALFLTWAAERVAPDHAARALGAIGASIFAGSIVFPPLIGEAARLQGFSFAWIALGVLLGIASLGALAAGRRGAGSGAPLGN